MMILYVTLASARPQRQEADNHDWMLPKSNRSGGKETLVCTMLLLVEQTTPRVWEPGTPGSRTAETAERERKAEYNC